jgi:hypothetical protein
MLTRGFISEKTTEVQLYPIPIEMIIISIDRRTRRLLLRVSPNSWQNTSPSSSSIRRKLAIYPTRPERAPLNTLIGVERVAMAVQILTQFDY